MNPFRKRFPNADALLCLAILACLAGCVSPSRGEEPTVKLSFEKGESVMIREGAFENYEGTVDELFPEKGTVRVLVSIFGRQAPVDLEEWMISKVEDS